MSVNDITGDRIVTDIPSEKFKSGWEGIWGNKTECEGCKLGWETGEDSFHMIHRDPAKQNDIICTKRAA